MMPSGRKKILQNILDLYRNNLRDNQDLDAIMMDKYIKAVEAISEKLYPKELQYVAMRIQEEKAMQQQLKLFAVTPDKNPVDPSLEDQFRNAPEANNDDQLNPQYT